MNAPIGFKAERIISLSIFFEYGINSNSILEIQILGGKQEEFLICFLADEATFISFPFTTQRERNEFLHYNIKKMIKLNS